MQAAAGKSMGCSKAAKAEAGVKAAAAAAKAEAGCVVAAARQEDLNSQSDYLTNHTVYSHRVAHMEWES